MTEQAEGHFHIAFRLESDLAIVVTQAKRFLRTYLANEPDLARILTALMELTRNAVRYAEGGDAYLEVQPLWNGYHLVTVRVEDEGPGIADLDAAMQDAFSTGKSLGLGLPGVKRLMDNFYIDTKPGHGTRVRATREVRAKT